MKIAILAHAGLGGSSKIALSLAQSLAEHGDQIEVFLLHPPLMPCKKHPCLTVNTFYSNNAGHIIDDLPLVFSHEVEHWFYTSLVDAINNQCVDIVHYHYAIPFASICAKAIESARYKVPLIGTFHGSDIFFYSDIKEYRKMLLPALMHTNALTAVSENLALLAASKLKLKRDILVIYNFLSESSSMVDRFSDNGCRPLKLVHASNLRPIKRPKDIIAIHHELEKFISAELWLLGCGVNNDNIKEYLSEKNNAKNVYFIENKTNILSVLSHMDIALITSDYESFSLFALESMAMGVIPVVSKVGGLPEVVGTAGSYFEVGNINQAVKCILNIANNDGYIQQRRKFAMQKSREYTLSNALRKYRTLYHKLLEES